MGSKQNLSGKQFGRLTVTDQKQKMNGKIKILCACSCGNTVYVSQYDIVRGNTSSCGCLRRELLAKSNVLLKTKHGQAGTRLYQTWSGMKKRCYKKDDKDYCRYGARGIVLCDAWITDFQEFYNWAMCNGYADDLTIDRINNDGNYEPDNCQWATVSAQNNNRRTNHLLTLNGETKNIKQWAEIYGMHRVTLSKKINQCGQTIEQALGLA